MTTTRTPLTEHDRRSRVRKSGYTTKDGHRIRTPQLVLRYVLLLAVTAVMVGPFVWQLFTSLKGVEDDLYAVPPTWLPGNPTFDNYFKVTAIVPILSFVRNSLIVAVANVLLNVAGSSLAGYALARLRFKGRSLALAVFFGALLVPGEASIIALVQLMNSVHLTNTLTAVVLPGCIGALNVLLMRNAFLALPREIDEAAALDGANSWRRFWNIALPSAIGTLTVVGLLSFIGAWDDFLWPLLILTDNSKYTLTIGLNYLQGTFSADPRIVAAGTIIAVAPLIVIFLIFQRQFFKGVGEGSVKG